MSNQSSAATPARTWGAVIPAKRLSDAKSRLTSLGDDVRRDLVVAFLHDTLSAVLDGASVRTAVVVTDDVALAGVARDLGAVPIPDGHGSDLNGALVQGAADVARRWPDLGVLVACADLPALRGEHLDDWLAVAFEGESAMVADASGTGTTLLRARCVDALRPAFGHDSRARHREAGVHDLTDNAARAMRQDVDTPADLEAARALGLGERTRWVMTRHRL